MASENKLLDLNDLTDSMRANLRDYAERNGLELSAAALIALTDGLFNLSHREKSLGDKLTAGDLRK